MRYICYQTQGPPPPLPPVGMKDIVGMGEYKCDKNAKQHLTRCAMGKPHDGYDHVGLYASPLRSNDDRLVHTWKLV